MSLVQRDVWNLHSLQMSGMEMRRASSHLCFRFVCTSSCQKTMCKVGPSLVDRPDQQRRGRVERCEFVLRNSTEAVQTWPGKCRQVTKLGYIYRYDPLTKMQSAVWLFPNESPPQSLKKKITLRTEENGCLFLRKIGPCRHHSSWGQTSSHCGLVRASLSPEGFRSLVPASPKDGTPSPFSLSWQCQWAHNTAATTVAFLNESEMQLLPHPQYSPDLSPCDFLLSPEVKKTTDWYPVWERRRCMSSVHEGCWRPTQINLGWGVEQVVSLHDKEHSCWRKVLWKKWILFCLLSPISNKYPKTVGASLVPNCKIAGFIYKAIFISAKTLNYKAADEGIKTFPCHQYKPTKLLITK